MNKSRASVKYGSTKYLNRNERRLNPEPYFVLLYFVLHRLKVSGALLAAAFFALHPVMVESVAWMCEQKNTLSTMLYLGGMLMYLKFDASRLRRYYALALSLFVLALLTKTITAKASMR